MSEPPNLQKQVVNSALWAAYGDALGFITELAADIGAVRARAKVDRVTSTIPWTRRIGGKFGVTVPLPAGCYSDDTQLRLATSRSIRADVFDVETFAKVELPVWQVYALGGGRGTKAAAASLAHQSRSWSTNLFSTKSPRYVDGGGNGAAMRIQPHVWSARNWEDFHAFLPALIRNVICTHGHPRALVGAAFHALCLGYSLTHREPTTPDVWRLVVDAIRVVPNLLEQDSEIKTVWIPLWEQQAGRSIVEGLRDATAEMERDIDIARRDVLSNVSPDMAYRSLVNDLGCLFENERGSGTKTALLSSALTYLFRDEPNQGLEVAVNLLGSDTDTISTMAGAMFGACVSDPPAGPIADEQYVLAEATRMAHIHEGTSTEGFQYPDLLRWNPPSTVLDYVGSDPSGHLAVAGLGEGRPSGQPFPQRDTGTVWQWMELKFGQRILAKRRERPKPLNPALLPGMQQSPQRTTRPVQPASPPPPCSPPRAILWGSLRTSDEPAK